MFLLQTSSCNGSLLGTILFLIVSDTLTQCLFVFTKLYNLELSAIVSLLGLATPSEMSLLGTEFHLLELTTFLLVGNNKTFSNSSALSWSIQINLLGGVLITNSLFGTFLDWNLSEFSANLLYAMSCALTLQFVFGTELSGSLFGTNFLSTIRVANIEMFSLGTSCLFISMSGADSSRFAVLVTFGEFFEFQAFSSANNSVLITNPLLTNSSMFQTLSSDIIVFDAMFLA